MSNRIEQLAEQAGFLYDISVGLVAGPEANPHKFAQLIVLECEKVAKDPQWYSKSPSNSWRNPINHVCSVMKEHFGVEE